MKRTPIFLCAIFIFSWIFCFGQNEDIDALFEDGKPNTMHLVVKVIPTNFIVGDIGGSVELKTNSAFSFEVGVGFCPFYNRGAWELIYDIEDFSNKLNENMTAGYSFFLNPFVAFGRRLSNDHSRYMWGIKYKKRLYSMENPSKISINDYAFNWAYQLEIGERMTLEFLYDLFIRSYRQNLEGVLIDEDFTMGIGLEIKLGYIF